MEEIRYSFSEWQKDGRNISLDFTEDDARMNCYLFHDLCKRFAVAIGYPSDLVEKVFGKTQYEEML